MIAVFMTVFLTLIVASFQTASTVRNTMYTTGIKVFVNRAQLLAFPVLI